MLQQKTMLKQEIFIECWLVMFGHSIDVTLDGDTYLRSCIDLKVQRCDLIGVRLLANC